MRDAALLRYYLTMGSMYDPANTSNWFTTKTRMRMAVAYIISSCPDRAEAIALEATRCLSKDIAKEVRITGLTATVDNLRQYIRTRDAQNKVHADRANAESWPGSVPRD
jgi:glutaredoxin-related protein